MQLEFAFQLAKSREAVWRAFDSPDNLKKWQPTLVSFEPLNGTPGQPGAQSRLTYKEGSRTVILTETITLRREPEEFAGTYDSGMALNAIHNRFEVMGPATTLWVVRAEFRFRGIWRLLSPLFRGAIEKRMREDLERFKTQLESGSL